MSRGVLLMALAISLFAVMNLTVKLLPNIPAVELVFFRSLISLLISWVTLKSKSIPVLGKTENRKFLLLRGLCGALALVMYFYTLQVMPLASAVTFMFLAPVFTAILGTIIIKENVAPWQWLFFGMAFCGILIIQGVDERITLHQAALGVGGALLSGLAYNFIKKVNTSEHPLVIVFYFPLVTLPLTGAYVAFHWVQPQGIEWAYLLLLGVLTQFAQYFMTMAYQADEISKVASVQYLGIIFALGIGYFVFGETFDRMTYVGMSVVLLGVLLNLWYKRRTVVKVLK